MAGDGSFLSVLVDDPRWEVGAVVAGIGGLLWYEFGTPWPLDAGALVAGAIALAGVAVIALAVADAAMAARVARSGMEARGRVTAITRARPTRGYVLRYRFRDDVGVEFEGRRFLSQTDAFDWREGDEGPVRFEMGNASRNIWLGTPSFERKVAPAALRAPAPSALPTGSEIFRRSRHLTYAVYLLVAFMVSALLFGALMAGAFRSGKDDTGAFVYTGVLVVGFLFIGLWQLHRAWREAAEGARILREGIAADASVMSIDEERARGRMGVSMSVGWTVSYSYPDRAGRVHYGKSGFIPTADATRWRTGDRCPVWYDPENPGRSVWAG